MKLNFCTLFDSGFLIRGLAMYQSLAAHTRDFHLYIFAFDDMSLDILTQLQLPHVTVISLAEFENEDLLKVKPDRSVAEYCWTCTPSVILYSIEKFGLDACTYIDADLLFFDSPEILLNELSNDSILISPHRYTPGKERAYIYGKYCVQFNTFKNNTDGLTALKWWRDECIKWCYIRLEDGKFGDQKYLDDWPQRFTGVHELQHLGGGVAPWNIPRYHIFKKDDGKIYGKENETGQEFPLIFYHFHNTRLYDIAGTIKVRSYYLINIDRTLRALIYRPYETALRSALNLIKGINPKFKKGFKPRLGYLYAILQESTPNFIKRPIKKFTRLSEK